MQHAHAWFISIPFLMLAAGCAAGRTATPTETKAITDTLVEYEKSKGADDIWAESVFPQIRVRDDHARAKYKTMRRYEQIASNPIAVELENRNGDWAVISEKGDWPWWWHVMNHTVGLK